MTTPAITEKSPVSLNMVGVLLATVFWCGWTVGNMGHRVDRLEAAELDDRRAVSDLAQVTHQHEGRLLAVERK